MNFGLAMLLNDGSFAVRASKRDTLPPSDLDVPTDRPPVDPSAPTLPALPYAELPGALGVPFVDDLDERDWR